MHGDAALVDAFGAALSGALPETVEVALLPPSILLYPAAAAWRHAGVRLGVQNVHWQDSGAFTGEISALMAKAAGCRYALVGHLERRTLCAEDDVTIARKYGAVRKAGMIPLLCVGESGIEAVADGARAVIAQQLQTALFGRDVQDCLIAYEPGRSIGASQTANPGDVQEMHVFIRHWITSKLHLPGSAIRILYGGSVKADNAQDLAAKPDIDGLLVGRASLHIEEFLAIIGEVAKAA